MIDLPLKLIDRCIELLKRRQENDRNLYADFIVPIMSDFESVHEFYLTKFRQYRDMASEPEFRLEPDCPFFEIVYTDRLYSQGGRDRLYYLVEALNRPVTSDLCGVIGSYLGRVSVSPVTIVEKVLIESPARNLLNSILNWPVDTSGTDISDFLAKKGDAELTDLKRNIFPPCSPEEAEKRLNSACDRAMQFREMFEPHVNQLAFTCFRRAARLIAFEETPNDVRGRILKRLIDDNVSGLLDMREQVLLEHSKLKSKLLAPK